jgi:topoisomerase-4 subunit A
VKPDDLTPDLFANLPSLPEEIPQTLPAAAPIDAEPPLPPQQPPESGHADPSLPDYAARRYLEYAISVVTGRAIPAVSDGQKPVQRRILYAMHRMGLYRSPKPVKSARVVGDVIGRYHPHGDSAVYEAMVRMAQDWSLRYPIVDGQGNFGSLDGDNAAAMRYTEARLTDIAELLLSEIDEGTVDFVPNYDGAEREPAWLPARLPFIALNGAAGIAVGMATEIPPHNLHEVAAACVALVRTPKLDDAAVLDYIPGPDFPGGGQIISTPDEIRVTQQGGRGSLRVRARWTVEPLARGQWRILIYALPPGVSVAKVMAEIDARSNPQGKEKGGKKVISPADANLKAAFLAAIDAGGVRDESDKNHKLRLVIEPRSSRDEPEDLMRLLLAHTSLEINVPVNLTLLGLDRKPKTSGLVAILREWCGFRVGTVRRRSQHRLEAAQRRIHILEGREKILLDIDRAIRIIRKADDPKADLMQAFGLTAVQADDVLEIRLRQLARLEAIKISEELKKLRKTEAGLQKLLDSETALRKAVANEIEADAATFGDARRTLIETADKVTASQAKSLVDEPVTLIVSRHGWLRSRHGHGVDMAQLAFRSGDALLAVLPCRSVDYLALIDTQGRAYSIPAADIPGGKGDGIPASSLIELFAGARIMLALAVNGDTPLIAASSGGYGFRCTGRDLISRGKAGKAFLSLQDKERPLLFTDLPAKDGEIACLCKDGRALVFPLAEIRPMAKGRGLKLITAAPGKTELDAILPVIDGRVSRKLNPERTAACRAPRGSNGRKV